MNKDDTFYGLKNDEQLKASVREVVEAVIGWASESDVDIPVMYRVPWPIHVYKFRRVALSDLIPLMAKNLVRGAMDIMHEEHGDPDGEPPKPSQRMQDAATAFATVMVEDYTPWACEPTGEVVEVTREMAEEMLK